MRTLLAPMLVLALACGGLPLSTPAPVAPTPPPPAPPPPAPEVGAKPASVPDPRHLPPITDAELNLILLVDGPDGCALTLGGRVAATVPGKCLAVDGWEGRDGAWFAGSGAGLLLETNGGVVPIPAPPVGRLVEVGFDGETRGVVDLPVEDAGSEDGPAWRYAGRLYPYEEGEFGAPPLEAPARLERGGWVLGEPELGSPLPRDASMFRPFLSGPDCAEDAGIGPAADGLCVSPRLERIAYAEPDEGDTVTPIWWSDGTTWRPVPGFEAPGTLVEIREAGPKLILARQGAGPAILDLRTGAVEHPAAAKVAVWSWVVPPR